MVKNLLTPCLLAALLLLAACQKEKTSSLDEPLPLPEPAASDKPGLADKLWPGNWFKDSEPDKVTAHSVLSDMSPELVTRGETAGERDILFHRVVDENTAQIHTDLSRMFFFERPSRLSLYPTP